LAEFTVDWRAVWKALQSKGDPGILPGPNSQIILRYA